MFDDDERDYCGDLYPQGKHSFGEEEAPYHHRTRKPRKRWSRGISFWTPSAPTVLIPGRLTASIGMTAWYLNDNELEALRTYANIREKLVPSLGCDKYSRALFHLGLLDKRKSGAYWTYYYINDNGRQALDIRT